jgi:ferredoxin-NADP reductase
MTEAPPLRTLSAEQQRSVELMAEVKFAVRMLLQKYATESAEIFKHSQDTAVPVIAVVQMALAQAATEYLITSGRAMDDAVRAMSSTTEQAMHKWMQTLFKQHSQTTADAAPAPKAKKQRARNGRSVQNSGR